VTALIVWQCAASCFPSTVRVPLLRHSRDEVHCSSCSSRRPSDRFCVCLCIAIRQRRAQLYTLMMLVITVFFSSWWITTNITSRSMVISRDWHHLAERVLLYKYTVSVGIWGQVVLVYLKQPSRSSSKQSIFCSSFIYNSCFHHQHIFVTVSACFLFTQITRWTI